MGTRPVSLGLTSNEFALGATSAAIVDDIERIMDTQVDFLRRLGCADRIGSVAAGGQVGGVPAYVPPQYILEVRGYTMNCAIRSLWKRTRIVYSIHPDMQRELVDSTSGRLPGDVFRLLPHTNPMIVFPGPVPISSPDGKHGRVLGIYVFGRRDEGTAICSTHDDQRDLLGLMCIIGLYDDRGNRVDTEVIRMHIPIGMQTFTIDDAVDRTLTLFAANMDAMLSMDQLRAWVGELMGLAINTLLYLCTDRPDLTAVRDRKRKRKPGKKKGSDRDTRPPTMIRVGWRIGPALMRVRKRAAAYHRKSDGSRRQPPHQRRCHYRWYHVGPGRTESVLKFIKPYMVNVDLLDTELDVTVVPVSRPRPAPANRRSR